MPEDARARLDGRLIANGYSDYENLSKLLSEEGYQISKSTLHRHGQELEAKLNAIKVSTDAAKAIVTAAPDSEGAMNDALMRLVQEKLFSILVELDEVKVKEINIASLGRTIAQLARASVNQKKWEQEMREKIAARVKAANQTVDAAAKSGGIKPETAAEIRKALLGIGV